MWRIEILMTRFWKEQTIHWRIVWKLILNQIWGVHLQVLDILSIFVCIHKFVNHSDFGSVFNVKISFDSINAAYCRCDIYTSQTFWLPQHWLNVFPLVYIFLLFRHPILAEQVVSILRVCFGRHIEKFHLNFHLDAVLAFSSINGGNKKRKEKTKIPRSVASVTMERVHISVEWALSMQKTCSWKTKS